MSNWRRQSFYVFRLIYLSRCLVALTCRRRCDRSEKKSLNLNRNCWLAFCFSQRYVRNRIRRRGAGLRDSYKLQRSKKDINGKYKCKLLTLIKFLMSSKACSSTESSLACKSIRFFPHFSKFLIKKNEIICWHHAVLVFPGREQDMIRK